MNKAAQMQALQQALQIRRNERAKAEANLETAQAQIDEALKELKALGLTPSGLEAEIQRLEREYDAKIALATSILEG